MKIAAQTAPGSDIPEGAIMAASVGLGGKIKALWWMLRPWNIVQAVAWGVAGVVLGTQGDLPVGGTIAAVLLIFVGHSTGQWANDMVDVEADRINKPDRPLPSGVISMREVAVAWTLANAAAVAIAWLMNPWAGLLALVSLPLPIMYTKMKGLGIFGTLVMGVCCGAAVAFGSLLVSGTVPEVMWWLMAGIVLFDINLNTMGACKDVEGDRAEGVGTLAVRIGVRLALVVAILGQVASLAVAFGPYARGLLSWEYLPLVIVVELAAVAAAVWYAVQPTPDRHYSAGRVIKAMWLAHPLAFVAGYLPVLPVVAGIIALQLMTLGILFLAKRSGMPVSL